MKARTLFAPVRGAKRKKNEKNESLWDSWDTMKKK